MLMYKASLSYKLPQDSPAEMRWKIHSVASEFNGRNGVEIISDMNGHGSFTHVDFSGEERDIVHVLREFREATCRPFYVSVNDGKLFSDYDPIERTLAPGERLRRPLLLYGRYVVGAGEE